MAQDWIENARAAKKALAGKKHGEVETSLLDAGWKDANTARRAIAALRYIDDLKRNEAEVFRALHDAPFSITELLARWNAFDKKGASKKAMEWARSKFSVRVLADALSEARKLDAGATTKEDVAVLVRKRVEEPLTTKLRNLLGNSVSGAAINFKAPGSPPVDFRFEFFVDVGGEVRIRTVCVVIVGPYTNASIYSKRRHDWIVRGFGLAWFFDRIFLVVPTADLLGQYRSDIRVYTGRAADLTANVRKPEVAALHIPEAAINRLTAEEAEAVSRLSG
jgi:hypothetical protein